MNVADPVLYNLRFLHGLVAQFMFKGSDTETCLMADDEDFFSERADQSEVKARIVTGRMLDNRTWDELPATASHPMFEVSA
jgi:hypothetical protein